MLKPVLKVCFWVGPAICETKKRTCPLFTDGFYRDNHKLQVKTWPRTRIRSKCTRMSYCSTDDILSTPRTQKTVRVIATDCRALNQSPIDQSGFGTDEAAVAGIVSNHNPRTSGLVFDVPANVTLCLEIPELAKMISSNTQCLSLPSSTHHGPKRAHEKLYSHKNKLVSAHDIIVLVETHLTEHGLVPEFPDFMAPNRKQKRCRGGAISVYGKKPLRMSNVVFREDILPVKTSDPKSGKLITIIVVYVSPQNPCTQPCSGDYFQVPGSFYGERL